MKRRWQTVLAWILVALSAVWMIIGKILEEATDVAQGDPASEALLGIAFMCFPVVGALVVSRQPRNALGWVLLFIGSAAALLINATAYAHYSLGDEHDLPFDTLAAWLEAWLWYPLVLLFPTFVLLLFPTGRLPSRRWRPLAWVAAAWILVISAGSMLEERLVGDSPLAYDVDNPIGIPGLGDIEDIGILWLLVVPIILLCLLSLIVRFFTSRGQERQQMKWVVYTMTVLIPFMALSDTLALPEWLFPLILLSLPLSIGFSVLNYRLYDVDLVINRTIVYVALSAILLGVYILGVTLLQRILGPLTEGNDLAVAASTLGVAALFNPARRRVQGFIDHYFYRRKYDAQRTIDEFASHLRDEVDIDALTSHLLETVRESMHPTHASLWIRIGDEAAT